MECGFRLLTGIMMPGVEDNVQAIMEALDGGITFAIMHSSLVAIVIQR